MSSNHAKTCKESILVDVKELLKLYDRVTIHLPNKVSKPLRINIKLEKRLYEQERDNI